MAEERDAQERTEQATPRRLEEARRRGQIVRSRELTTVLLLLASGAAIVLAGGGMGAGMAQSMKRMLALPTRELLAAHGMAQLLMGALTDALMGLVPLLLVTLLVSLFAPLAVGGWAWSSEALGPRWERLDPIAGFKRIFSTHSLVELAKAVLKLALITLALVALLWSYLDDLMGLEHMETQRGLAEALRVTSHCFFFLAATTIVIALIDVPWQIFSHARQLRMSKQELREELKETEGKPEIKAKIRRMQMEIASRRMMEEVPKADVIVTNPTHYAVALRYDPKEMAAPLLVAKGADEVAQQIIRIGAHHRVTTLSAPPLARAIFHSTKLGQQIPAGLYVAVARVLAYVFQLRARSDARDLQPPRDLPIPEDLRRDH